MLIVSVTDLKSGTPILDIKPYFPYTDAVQDARGGAVTLSFDYVMTSSRREQTDRSVMTLYMLRTDGGWKLAEVSTLADSEGKKK